MKLWCNTVQTKNQSRVNERFRESSALKSPEALVFSSVCCNLTRDQRHRPGSAPRQGSFSSSFKPAASLLLA